MNGQTTILGSSVDADDYRYQMDITSEGAVPISGTVNANISGSIVIGSVSAHVDSIYIQSGTMYQASGNTYVTSGIISVDNLYAGSYVYQGTNPWAVSGVINVGDTYVTSGNIAISNYPITYPGSVVVENNLTLQGVKTRGSGLVVFPKDHDRQIMGQEYLCGSVYYKMADAGSTCLLFNCGSCDVHMNYDSRTDGDAIMTIMENVAVTNSGVQNSIFNENRCFTNISNCSIWTNPTIGTSGTVLQTAIYLGGSGTSIKFVSAPVGTGVHGGQAILCNGSSYLIKTDNIAARTLSLDWNVVFHEHC